jgi:hypothetical protein
VTGSLRHVYQLMGRDASEEMLLGLGAGVGFVYWQRKGTAPFLGGRANAGRPGEPGLETLAGQRTGVAVRPRTTASGRKAETELAAGLAAGLPAILQVDMGLLPYLSLPDDYHFGGHAVAVVGYDAPSGTVLVCDRDPELHPLSLPELAAARGSRFQPFPPRNASWTFDFAGQRDPGPHEVRDAIAEVATAMLRPPIRNMGVDGIRKAAGLIPSWPEVLDARQLQEACLNGYVMIDAAGGTRGGLFRYMYARFLEEAAGLIGDAEPAAIGARLRLAGDQWQQVAARFDRAQHRPDPAVPLSEIPPLMHRIADCEERAWRDLLAAVGPRARPRAGAAQHG